MAVVRIRRTPGGADKYGDPIASDEDQAAVPGAFTAPRTSVDIDGRARDGAVAGLSLFAPKGADIERTDLIEVDGDRYRIDGDLGDWTSPLTGWEPGIAADLVRAEG